MKRISMSKDRFEADENEVITVIVEAKNTPHATTFSNDGPAFTTVANPPPVEKRTFTMGAADTSFTITYGFPPDAQRDPQAQYEVTFQGKNGTSDGPNTILPLAAIDSITPLYEFRKPI